LRAPTSRTTQWARGLWPCSTVFQSSPRRRCRIKGGTDALTSCGVLRCRAAWAVGLMNQSTPSSLAKRRRGRNARSDQDKFLVSATDTAAARSPTKARPHICTRASEHRLKQGLFDRPEIGGVVGDPPALPLFRPVGRSTEIGFREQVTEYLNRARLEPDGELQRRSVDIAQHRILAEADASNASRMGDERRARRHDAK
jgi:hypothetical protein